MKIALASDHAGFEQLNDLASYVEAMGHQVLNFGPKKLTPGDDYPDFVMPAARSVAKGESQFGIILGGSGQGEAMAANKIKGVRCAVFYGPAVPRKVVDIHGRRSHDPYEIVKLTKQHNDANMLSIAARFVTLADMKHVIELWLGTPFNGEEHHSRRVDKVNKLGD